MVPNFGCPESKHTPKRNKHTEEVGDKKHSLGLKFEVSLDVPKPESRCNRTGRLRDSQVSYLQKRK